MPNILIDEPYTHSNFNQGDLWHRVGNIRRMDNSTTATSCWAPVTQSTHLQNILPACC